VTSSVPLSFTGGVGGTSPYSYTYKRGTDGVTFGTTLATHTAQTSSDTYTDSSGTPGTGYYYEVVVTDAASGTSTSNIIGPLTPTATLTAGTLSATAITSSSIALALTAASGGTSPYSYAFKRGTNGSVFGTTVATHTGQTSSDTLTDSTVTSGGTYYYEVVVTDAASGTSTSNIVGPFTASTLATGSLTNGTVTSSSVPLSFTGATGGLQPYTYTYKRGTNGTTFGTTVATHAGQTSSDTDFDMTVAASTTYYYEVIATDGFGNTVTSSVLGPIVTPALSATFVISGANTGQPGVGVTYTFTPGSSYSGTITPSDGLTGGGGSWSPATLTFGGTTAQTSVYTGPGPGTRTITASGSSAAFNTITLVLTYSVAYNIVFKGDSLTYSQYASTIPGGTAVTFGATTTTWPGVLVNALGARFQGVQRGVPGQQAADVTGSVASEAAGDYVSGMTNIAIVQYGTNDLRNGYTQAQLIANMTIILAAYRSAGYKTIVQTIEPAYLPSATINPTYDQALQQPYNAWLRANWKTVANGISDFGFDVRVGQAGAELNTTYFRSVDNTHLTDTGYAVVAGYAAQAVMAVIDSAASTGQPASIVVSNSYVIIE
jgi:lysophospholipase L1-like esterase